MIEGKSDSAIGTERAAASMNDVKINERVVVWRVVNNEKRRVLATLLKKRICEPKIASCDLHGKIGKEDRGTIQEEYEYFVHFDGQDRRLDQWISGEQFIELAPKLSTVDIGVCDVRLRRKRRRENEDELLSLEEIGAQKDHHRKAHPEKNIEKIVFGRYEIQCWYYSPYRLKKKAVDRLFICQNCLLYTEDRRRFACHLANDCKQMCPPGEHIYEENNIKVYEVFGALEKLLDTNSVHTSYPSSIDCPASLRMAKLNFYCQRLCLLAKLFIDHKTLCFDVENFIFYLLCEVDDDGNHIAAMFSKEMYSANNLACIMTLPCYQRKGYGNLLIQLSYEMSKRAKYPGTPERPFSDLGEISYKKYWLWVLLEFFDSNAMRKVEDVTVDDLEALVGINKEDIKDTMGPIGLLSHLKGGTYIVHNPKLDQDSSVERPGPPLRRLNAKYLMWNAKTFDRPKRRN
ncbi:MOZ/SAS family protein [Dictyocaulus viviparus]|uniref:histone acetyltransferase n=1 Tax=Dictyocaulus viviparus TaxID=29172 RepID=A0A0D8Y3H3_DICVI|nr:MOZ/SAS family protein [Dictyocaulus viviparus]